MPPVLGISSLGASDERGSRTFLTLEGAAASYEFPFAVILATLATLVTLATVETAGTVGTAGTV